MSRILPGFILPSAAYGISHRLVKNCRPLERNPRVGDLIYGRVKYLGEHSSLENKEGRIHMITDRSRAIFVFGNRYAPDYFEGRVPTDSSDVREVDLLARSGVVGVMKEKNSAVKDPTRIEVLGYIVAETGEPLNTRNYPVAVPKNPLNKDKPRAKMILHVGTSMNSGKSTSAIACCWALAAMGYAVRASKITGTASLKDILHMQDAGASLVSDFSYLGYPSTYMLEEDELVGIFESLDAKYGGNPKRYWVVELADGVMQRETAMLLRNEYLRSRIHRLVFSASDAFGAIGGLNVLKNEFSLVPNAISGRCTSSPLMIRELGERTEIPIYNNVLRDLKLLNELLI